MVGRYGNSMRMTALSDPVKSSIAKQVILESVMQRHSRGEDRALSHVQTTKLVLVAGRYGRSARVAALFDPVESAVDEQLILEGVMQRHSWGRAMHARARIQHQAAGPLGRPLCWLQLGVPRLRPHPLLQDRAATVH